MKIIITGLTGKGLPTVQYIAEKLNVSPGDEANKLAQTNRQQTILLFEPLQLLLINS
jgi:hypothetical protein